MTFMKSALLIEASDVKSQTHIPGAKLDIANWAKYLSSNAGGAWDSVEQKGKPCKQYVEEKLREFSFFHGYVFIVFSGHGYRDRGRDMILLNDSEEMEVAKIQAKVPYTLVVDACRGEEEASVVTESFGVARASSFSVLSKTASASSSRLAYQSLFDQQFSRLNGKATMFSCSIGEAAGENPESGGVYTNALLKSCRFWHDTDGNGPRILSTYDAHLAVVKRLTKLRSRQNPVFSHTGSGNFFPIAVRA